MRRAATDKNQKEIVDALRMIGAGVVLLHRLGEDVPDLLVAWKGRTVLMEVKNPDGRDRVSVGQKRFIEAWPGEVAVVRSTQEALAAVGLDVRAL